MENEALPIEVEASSYESMVQSASEISVPQPSMEIEL